MKTSELLLCPDFALRFVVLGWHAPKQSLDKALNTSKRSWLANRMTEMAIFSAWICSSWLLANANEVLPGQRDQFAGATCTLHVKLPDRLAGETVRWRLASGERTLANGRSLLQLVSEAEKGFTIYTFEFTTPELNEGIAIGAQLTFGVAQVKPGSASIVIRHADPFVELEYSRLRIVVIDPDGSMASKLKTTSLDARYVKKVTDVREESCVIVGEGIRWDSSVSDAVAAWVRLGMHVIVLRSQVGSAASIEPMSGVGKLDFSQLRQSGWSSPKLDEEYWPIAGNNYDGWSISLSPEKLTLTPYASKGQLKEAQLNEAQANEAQLNDDRQLQLWQLVELRTQRGGDCLFVGVPVMELWNQSPVPREFLKNAIEKMGLQLASNPNSRTK